MLAFPLRERHPQNANSARYKRPTPLKSAATKFLNTSSVHPDVDN